MRHLFVINPTAGQHDNTNRITKMIRDFFGNRVDFDIVRTEYKGHAIEIARNAGETGLSYRIYSMGGDGTLNEIVQGMIGFNNLSVTSFPCGTGNDFIKSFDNKELFNSIENLVNAKDIEIDVIKCGDRIGINVCSVGFDAEAASNLDKMKKIPFVTGNLAYTVALFYGFLFNMKNHFKLVIDDHEEYEGDYLFAVAANGKYYGGGFMPAPLASIKDGMLDIVIIKAVSRMRILGLIEKYKKGEHINIPEITTYKKAKKLNIKSNKAFSVNLDGECFQSNEVTFEIIPTAIKFAVPEIIF
ncbi:MAG TPA: diacylglycerol kinase family protein [Clostridia bacterium]|nr:diacylglycerol kinase family protein [Clostridia bacterium]